MTTYPCLLTVCLANMLRSPTAAVVLAQKPYCFNTRSCGVEDYALIKITDALVIWADYIVCMDSWIAEMVRARLNSLGIERPIYNLNISDDYEYMEEDLVRLIKCQWENRKVLL